MTLESTGAARAESGRKYIGLSLNDDSRSLLNKLKRTNHITDTFFFICIIDSIQRCSQSIRDEQQLNVIEMSESIHVVIEQSRHNSLLVDETILY